MTTERIHWIAAAMLVLIMALTGCTSTGYRPYTARERIALGHALLGQSLDAMTTSMALTDDRASEGNPIFWGDDAEAIIVGKFVLMSAAYLAGEIWPESRESIWWIIAGGGYGPAAWNTYQIIDNGINPWRD